MAMRCQLKRTASALARYAQQPHHYTQHSATAAQPQRPLTLFYQIMQHRYARNFTKQPQVLALGKLLYKLEEPASNV